VITTATAATLGTHIKAANVRTGVAYRVIGFVDATFTTATGWGSLAAVQGAGGQALAAMSSLGYGQTWKAMTFAMATTYYNTSGKPKMVSVVATYSSGALGTWTVNGYDFYGNSNPLAGPKSAVAIIPPGASFSFAATAGTVTSPTASELS